MKIVAAPIKVNDTECLQIKVEDTGTGIKEENIDKLFDMFSSFNNETTNKSGIGLGLYTSK